MFEKEVKFFENIEYYWVCIFLVIRDWEIEINFVEIYFLFLIDVAVYFC